MSITGITFEYISIIHIIYMYSNVMPVMDMIIRFRLTAPNWERPSPDYGSHIIMSITGITFEYISIIHIHHLQVLSSIPGARDNIFHISYNTISLLTYTSALFGSLAPTELLPPAPLGRGLIVRGETAPKVRGKTVLI